MCVVAGNSYLTTVFLFCSFKVKILHVGGKRFCSMYFLVCDLNKNDVLSALCFHSEKKILAILANMLWFLVIMSIDLFQYKILYH